MDKTTVLVADVGLAPESLDQPRAEDWRLDLPVLSAGEVVLREVRASDAQALVSLITTPEITRYLSTPPQTESEFEQFIVASQRLRMAGGGACFAVTLRGYDTAIGLFQVRRLATGDDDARFGGTTNTAEWGFAIGSPFWGSGIFEQSASLVVAFAFERLAVHRLEARCAVKNGRGGKALLKVGAVPEGILRKAFVCGNERLDQVLYAIVEQEWRARHDDACEAALALVH